MLNLVLRLFNAADCCTFQSIYILIISNISNTRTIIFPAEIQAFAKIRYKEGYKRAVFTLQIGFFDHRQKVSLVIVKRMRNHEGLSLGD